MQKSIAVFLIAFATLASTAAQLMGSPVLPTLAPGSSYQLIFVTSDTIAGNSPIEPPYNALVNTDAAPLNTLLATAGITGVTWHAITSTFDGTSASVNAAWGGVPVFNTQGLQVTVPSQSLYSGALAIAVQYDENGGTAAGSTVWTGATITGGIAVNAALGIPIDEPVVGHFTASNVAWLDATKQAETVSFPLYGLSSVITVPLVPEPSSGMLAGLGIGGFAAWGWRRKRA